MVVVRLKPLDWAFSIGMGLNPFLLIGVCRVGFSQTVILRINRMYMLQHPRLKITLVFSRVTEDVEEKARKTGGG